MQLLFALLTSFPSFRFNFTSRNRLTSDKSWARNRMPRIIVFGMGLLTRSHRPFSRTDEVGHQDGGRPISLRIMTVHRRLG